MVRLEDIAAGKVVMGLTARGGVTIIAVKRQGPDAFEVIYKEPSGALDSQLLYRADEARLSFQETALPFTFEADAKAMRLVSEAYRIKLAYLVDPYLAIHSSTVEALPHQIEAVYGDMLTKHPLKFLLADDPGAGKTIMTGLYIKELLLRGDLKRCLIVSPGSLAEQWQDELAAKFGLKFDLITKDSLENAATGNVFGERDFCIARLDQLSRNEEAQAKLRAAEGWDLVVCDEAHKMSATMAGAKLHLTKRFELGRLLSGRTRHFLLLTATPHNGKNDDFRLFMSLLDRDRFGGHTSCGLDDVTQSGLMLRRVKEDLKKFDGTPLFPKREATTVNYSLSPEEQELYDEVTAYVRGEFKRADGIEDARKKNVVGFALTMLQRRLASSPLAIRESLRRRRERLEKHLADLRQGVADDKPWPDLEELDEDELTAEELESQAERCVDSVSAADTAEELEGEIATLGHLEDLAGKVQGDTKWRRLSEVLDDPLMQGEGGEGEKIIIFTEHRDTLNYLTDKLRSRLGRNEAVVTIHGGTKRKDRHQIENDFRQNKDVAILVATDAAGEGINLQRAHLMINYDLPWNPNRLEQRFGRIHRIGQAHKCYLWNLVASGTREGDVFNRLFAKLKEAQEALGDKVFNVLGKVTFDNMSLRDLIIKAIRQDREEPAKVEAVIDESLSTEAGQLRKLAERDALTTELGMGEVMAIREDMERQEAHKLSPYFIESFFLEALRRAVKASIHPRERDRWEITYLSSEFRRFAKEHGQTLPDKYERVCFDPARCQIDEDPRQADLISLGHPLLSTMVDFLLERHGALLRQGCVFIDEGDPGPAPRLLLYIQSAIQDGRRLRDGQRQVISRQLAFVEMKEDGTAENAGYAPYLDYRPATEDESEALVSALAAQPWLRTGLEDRATSYAGSEVIPPLLAEAKRRKEAWLAKTRQHVNKHLQDEINYLDGKAHDFDQKAKEGEPAASLNAQKARAQADDLQRRLEARQEELDQEAQITAQAPTVVGGAIIVPQGLLAKLGLAASPAPEATASSQEAKTAVELAAMGRVMEIEKSLGFTPRDVSAQRNIGYDIESSVPEAQRGPGGASLRFIEVKGRAAGADSVTLTKNEVLAACNKQDDFILAVVEVEGDDTHVTYMKSAIRQRPEFSATAIKYNLADLRRQATIILER